MLAAMEAGRRKRVDEFFSAKKRRHNGSKPSSTTSPSPIKRGTLANYLVTENFVERAQNLLESHIKIPTERKRENNEGLESLQGLHVGHSSQVNREVLDTCDKICLETEIQPAIDEKLEKLSASVAVDVKVENLKESCVALDHHNEVKESKGSSLQNDKHKFELSQFANDFLSMCCSGIASAKVISPINVLGSVAHQSKDLCVESDIANDADDIEAFTNEARGIGTEGINNEFIEKNQVQFTSSKISVENIAKITGENKEICLLTDISKEEVSASIINPLDPMNVHSGSKCFEALANKGTITAASFESPTVLHAFKHPSGKNYVTPQTNSGERLKGTLKWSGGSSLFSPGDEFWDEAIHWADELVSTKVDDISDKELTHTIVQTEEASKNLQSYMVSPCNEPLSKIISNTHISTDSEGMDRQAESDSKHVETPHPNSGLLLLRNTHRRENIGEIKPNSNSLCQEISPFPVRRFDFTSPQVISNHADSSVEGDPVENLSVKLADRYNTEEMKSSQVIVNEDDTRSFEGQMASNVTERQDGKQEKLTNICEKPVPIEGTLDECKSSSITKDDNTELKLELSDWLPLAIVSVYAKKGLKKLYPWQVECLRIDGVLEGKNLVYSASTSAGKSLVAEVLMLRQVLSTGKKAMLVLPYVSICHEKAQHLEALLEPLGKRVSSFFGTHGGASLPKEASIAVCTIEKANSLINKLLEEGRLPELAVVVIDELHMIGDRDRGYLLELMLTKLRYVAGEGKSTTTEVCKDGNSGKNLQIIGMSATMPNASAVASWLQAALYETGFRPVPLVEHIKVANVIYNKNMEVVRTIRKNADLAGKDPDHIVELCNEVVQEGHSVLLFCSSRKACETSAKHVAKFLPDHAVRLRNTISGPESAAAALEELTKCPSGLDPVLAETLPKGIAYHHAGLTVEEREMVESCYRSGIVRVLTATSTLAAGVNLPARRVIFRQPRIGRDFIDGTRYRQMSGRAGRAGIDSSGESILICKPEEVKRMSSLLNEGCQPLLSCLAEDKNGMTRAILEVIAGGIVQSANDVERYVKCTLLNSTQSFEEVVKSAQDSLHWLCHRKFLEWDRSTELYSCTPLGKAAFGSSLSPEESLIVFDDLAKAREGFVLASDLHLVYQVTPIYVELEPDWSLFYKKFVELSPMDQAVGNRVGVMEPFLMRMAHGAPNIDTRPTRKSPRRKSSPILRSTIKKSPMKALEQTLRVCRRFFVSLILANLVQEVPLMEICESFKVARGMVQSLQEVAGRFASMVSSFCERLGWHDLEGLVSKFQSRVSFGVRAEIVELAEIPFVKASRARALYKAGLRTPQAVAEASVAELAKALFESSSWGSRDGPKAAIQHRVQMGMAKKVQNGAKKLVLERAEEARVAAFSALRSLGVNVPAALSQSLAENSALAKRRIELDNESSSLFDTVDNDLNEQALHQTVLPVNTKPLKAQFSDQHWLAPCQSELHEGAQNALQAGQNVSGEASMANTEDRLNMGPIDVDDLSGGFEQFLSLWQERKDFFFDLNFSPGKDSATLIDVRGIAVCWIGSPIYYVSFGDGIISKNKKINSETLCIQAKSRWEKLDMIFSKEGVMKITWNWQSQAIAFRYPSFCLAQGQVGQPVCGIFEPASMGKEVYRLRALNFTEPPVDIRLATWLLWPDEESTQSLNLEQEVKKRLPGNVVAKATRDGRWINQMCQVAHNGCCRRVAQIRVLHSVVWKLLTAEGLDLPLLRQEMPLVSILSHMESHGIRVDIEGCKIARQKLETKIRQLEERAHELAGVLFSLSVPAEVASVLYTHLKLPVPIGCNKGKQHPTTDKQALDALMGQHPIVEVIKEHRTLSKVLNGTIGSLLFKARPVVADGTHNGTIRSLIYHVKGRWLQTSTATGRLSMEEPNLQCVEHPINLTIMQQSEGSPDKRYSVEHTINPRDFFIPFKEDWVLLSADYSQIEVRLMAHFSGDSSLIELLSRRSGDLFKTITARWTGVAETSVTAKQREHTKRLVYGILYGMGVNALAEQLECTVAEAAMKYNRFKNAFPGVANWLKEAVKNCREQGYVSTLSGRRRYLDKIKCGNVSERAKAERQAVNSICQGSAADLIKIAMIKLVSADQYNKTNSRIEGENDINVSLVGKYNLLLQIHDELVLEVEKNVVNEVGAWLRHCMENAASLKVPLLVKLKTGPRWGSLQSMED